MSSRRRRSANRPDPATEAYQEGVRIVMSDPALGSMNIGFCRDACRDYPPDGCARVDSNGNIHAHPTRRADPDTWAWSLAHCVLHLGFGHVPAAKTERTQPDRFDAAARCVSVHRFQ
ncbi:MAG: DUF2201 family putative metallopeptidase, partial [Stackebrandtia sp.]